jgi:hypothetical protein
MGFWKDRKEELDGYFEEEFPAGALEKVIESERKMLEKVEEDYILNRFHYKFEKEYGLGPSWEEELENTFFTAGHSENPVDNSIGVVKRELRDFADEMSKGQYVSKNALIEKIKRYLKDRGMED